MWIQNTQQFISTKAMYRDKVNASLTKIFRESAQVTACFLQLVESLTS